MCDSGLMVLSRVPIDVRARITYTAGASWDMLASKGALYVRLCVAGQRIHLFVTHLQASYCYTPERESREARADQLLELAHFIRQ